MNKILISSDKKITLKNLAVNLELKSKVVELTIEGEVTITQITPSACQELNIILKPKAILIFNKFNQEADLKLTLNIYQSNDSNFHFYYSLLALSKAQIKINTQLKGSNNTNTINIRGIAQSGELFIAATANVAKNSNDNVVTEDIKCLVLGDYECTVIPNMLISTDTVVANHNVSIGGLSPAEIFYLKAKGISENNVIQLIKEGLILNNLKLPQADYVKIKAAMKAR